MFTPQRILVVDDNPTNCAVLMEILADKFTVRCVCSGEDALEESEIFLPDLVLLDVMLPGIDGYETCRRMTSNPLLLHTRVVMVSARGSTTDRLFGYRAGARDYITKPFNDQEVLCKVYAWMRSVTHEQASALWSELEQTRDVIGMSLTTLTGFRSTETGEHLFRMRWYATALAEQLHFAGPYRADITEQFMRDLYRASPLHDIGKVAIGDAILLKPARLSPEEFELMKQHTTIGADILSRIQKKTPTASYLAMAKEIALSHHEWWNGEGYPNGISGDAIPLAARIVALADVFDALTSERVYKEAWPAEETIAEIQGLSGTKFDPAVVDAFVTRRIEFAQWAGRLTASTAREVNGYPEFIGI